MENMYTHVRVYWASNYCFCIMEECVLPGKGGVQCDFLHFFLKRHLPYFRNNKQISFPAESKGMGVPDLVDFTLVSCEREEQKMNKNF